MWLRCGDGAAGGGGARPRLSLQASEVRRALWVPEAHLRDAPVETLALALERFAPGGARAAPGGDRAAVAAAGRPPPWWRGLARALGAGEVRARALRPRLVRRG